MRRGSVSAVFDTRRPFGRLMNFLAKALLTRRSLRYELAFGTAAVAAATLLRVLIAPILPPGYPFLTFFPAIMLTLVFASIRAGTVVALVCGAIAWFWFIGERGAYGTTEGELLAMAFFAVITGTDILFLCAAIWALQALTDARARAETAAEARKLMFSELQHRISNNLQTVSTLLRMQSEQVQDQDAREALNASRTRIRAMSRLQRRLHSPDLRRIDAGEYLRELIQEAADVACNGKASLTFSADRLPVPHEVALPLGLIAGELAMNAVEHGTRAGALPQLVASLRVAAAEKGRIAAVLELRDHGPGLPPDFDVNNSHSLGLTISRQFATMLDGRLEMTDAPSGGAIARLHFSVAAEDATSDGDGRTEPVAPAPPAASSPRPRQQTPRYCRDSLRLVEIWLTKRSLLNVVKALRGCTNLCTLSGSLPPIVELAPPPPCTRRQLPYR